MQKLMTRHDTEVGDGEFDSIAWIFSEHLNEPDLGEYNAAVLECVNEDWPTRIELYRTADPRVNQTPDRVWVRQ